MTSLVARNRPVRSRAEAFRGAVLGGAIGDAMGAPVEFMSMPEIHRQFGSRGVTGFVQFATAAGHRFAPYTDDTQLAEVVLRSLVASRIAGEELDAAMTRMASGLVEWSSSPQGGHRAPGNACLAGCRRLAEGAHWSVAGGERAGGCGSVMRAWPFGLVFVDDLARAEGWAVAHSKLTHRDPIALASCAAVAVGTALLVRGEAEDVAIDAMAQAAARHDANTAAMVRRSREDAHAGASPERVFERLQGWAAHEALAGAVYLLARHPDDPQATILEGANTPGDSDSIASIAGALVGARCGLDALPERWCREVERSKELLALAHNAAALHDHVCA